MTDDVRTVQFRKVDVDAGSFRWYRLTLRAVSEDLFSSPEVLIERGRQGNRGERIRRTFDEHVDAEAYFEKKVRERLAHGYEQVDVIEDLFDENCLLCRMVRNTEGDPCFVVEFGSSTLFVGWDQTYRGRSLLVFRQHIPDFFRLHGSDLLRSHSEIRRAEKAIRSAFQPAMMNYLFMGNITGHVHLHLVPRYPDDPHFGSSPFLDSARVREPQLPAEEYAAIAAVLRSHVPDDASGEIS